MLRYEYYFPHSSIHSFILFFTLLGDLSVFYTFILESIAVKVDLLYSNLPAIVTLASWHKCNLPQQQ